MIGTDEMSSTGMDISESFRPEDISKTDFFDFVTAPDMGIGLGVNVNLHHSHHNHQQQQQQQQQHQQQHQLIEAAATTVNLSALGTPQLHQVQTSNGTTSFVYEYYKIPDKDASGAAEDELHWR